MTDEELIAEYNAALPPSTWPANNTEVATIEARKKRDGLLREVYDVGISMAARARRMGASSVACDAKVLELDLFALALQEVPNQAGFPASIAWPIVPNAEL
jgi:hypothetical protein